MAAYWDIFNSDSEDERVFCDRVDIYDISDKKFYKKYRFSKEAFAEICGILKLGRNTKRSSAISPEIELAVALRYYATGHFQLSISDTLNLSQPTVNRCISAVSKRLSENISEFVKWPGETELAKVKKDFNDIAGFPNIIGLIDCTHVRITKPQVDEFQYVNRKSYHSLNVQAVCLRNGLFSNVVCKHPGGTHDSFILKESVLWDYMESAPNVGYILGDSGYPLRPWLMTPLQSPSSNAELAYNNSHKRTRVLIENAFGMAKRRFHMLHVENRCMTKNISLDIAACIALHNVAIILKQEDFDDEVPEEAQPVVIAPRGLNTGEFRRQFLIENVFGCR